MVNKKIEITDLKDMLNKTKKAYGSRPAYKLRTKTPGEYQEITHKEVRDMVDCLGTALVSLLNLKGKRVAVIGENRYEWEVAYLSVVAGTGIVVPLDKALPENELDSLIRRSEVDAIFYSEKYEPILKKLAKDGTTKLKHLISMDAKENKDGVYSFNELIQKGKKLIEDGDIAFIEAEINPEEMTEILFTSGTTAKSKAVALCHRNLCENLMGMNDVLYNFTCEDKMLSFLPVHHVFECTAGFLLSLYKGMCTSFADGPRHIVENLREYGITFMVCVPALYEIMYNSILKKLEKAGKLEAVMALVEAHKNDTMEQKAKIFKDIHDIFGENIKLLVSGAAALDSKVEEGYRNFGINLVQGYGLTESSPVVCVNYFPGKDENKHRCGTIGKALPKVQVKIEEPNEEGIGELMVKGPNVMMGYFGDEEATKETIEDGWLHTGDLCSIDKDGYIYIYGRKKSVIVLKNGKNIFPEEMENLVNKIEEKNGPIAISGLTGVGSLQLLSGINEFTKKPILILTYNEIQAKRMLEDIKYFSDKVTFFPKKEVVTYDYVAESKELPYERIESLNQIISKKNYIIVTTIEAAMQKLPNKKILYKNSMEFKVGDIKNLEEIKQKLINLGYTRYELIDGRGQFSIRGGILDISITTEIGVRIEFWGDEIEKITEINPLTGKGIGTRMHILIPPASQYVTSKDKMEKAIKTIEEELEERIEYFKSQNKLIEAQRIEERTNFDIEMMKETGFCSGIENYSRHISQRPAGSPPYTLFDYFPDDFLLLIDESHATIPQVRAMYNGDRSRKAKPSNIC